MKKAEDRTYCDEIRRLDYSGEKSGVDRILHQDRQHCFRTEEDVSITENE
jgi:hypothetical protein